VQTEIPLDDHYESYRIHLKSEGRVPRHIKETIDRLQLMMQERQWSTLSSITKDEVARWIVHSQQKPVGKKGCKVMSPCTINHYTTAL